MRGSIAAGAIFLRASRPQVPGRDMVHVMCNMHCAITKGLCTLHQQCTDPSGSHTCCIQHVYASWLLLLQLVDRLHSMASSDVERGCSLTTEHQLALHIEYRLQHQLQQCVYFSRHGLECSNMQRSHGSALSPPPHPRPPPSPHPKNVANDVQCVRQACRCLFRSTAYIECTPESTPLP
jgi:hypothetical protein